MAQCGTKKHAQTSGKVAPQETSSASEQRIELGHPIGLESEALKPIIVYATRADYSTLVPILLTSEKQRIIAYPACTDLGSEGSYSLPIQLKDGFLYDRRGIAIGVAFLKLTYSEYCRLEDRLTPEVLLEDYILDDDPLTFFAICDRSQLRDESVEELNRYIERGLPGAKILVNLLEK